MYDLSGSRVLITGGAGFVGSHIADQLLNEDVAEIILLDNLIRGSQRNIKQALESNKVKFVKGDIRDPALLNVLFKGVDYCFHMAALRITRCKDKPKEAFGVLFEGTFNIINSCLENKVKKLIAASSASIYGQASSFPTNEAHHPYNNRTLYGAGKIANEAMYRAFADMYGLNYVAMRYFNIYGSRMDTEGKYTEVLIRWYKLIKEGKQPLIFGDGSQTMDFISVEDIARANILALKSNTTDEAFNVASQKETSLKNLCYTLLKVMNTNISPKFVPLPKERKSVEVFKRLADISKVEKLIGFKPEINLEDGLNRLINWLDRL